MKTRPATKTERQLALLWLVAAVSSVALKPLWLAATPHLRPCVFRSLTGFACPSCGTTRAAVAFLHGDLVAAFSTNPLATCAGLLFVAGAPIAMIWTLARGPVPLFSGPPSTWIRITLVVVLILNWAFLISTM